MKPTRPHSDIPLRETLRAAVAKRKTMLTMGWSKRKDIVRLRAAIARAEQFLASYPHANDLRVRGWVLEHHEDVAMIVPGNAPAQLARLVMHALTPEKPAIEPAA